MKNYTISNVDAKTFILNYEIKDGQIIINLASKEKYVIPYTEENEKKIIERMEYQVEYALGIKNDCETAIHKTKNYSIRWFMGFMISRTFGSNTGKSLSGTGTQPQCSQWIIGIGSPQNL